MGPARLDRLPTRNLRRGLQIVEAAGFTGRLLGLALLEELPADRALLIPRCRSIHTFGMRFPIDVVFLGERGQVLAIERELPPRRVAGVRAASSVLEACAGHGDRFLAAGAGEIAARLSRPRLRGGAGGT